MFFPKLVPMQLPMFNEKGKVLATPPFAKALIWLVFKTPKDSNVFDNLTAHVPFWTLRVTGALAMSKLLGVSTIEN